MSGARFFCGSVIVGLSLTSIGLAKERKIKQSDLPPAAQKTVAAQSQGATIKGFAEETENGKTLYEVELMVKGHSKTLMVDAAGSIVETEEQIPIQSLPAAVRQSLLAKAGDGTITRVESITKHNQVVAYEAQVETAGKRREVQVGPDGKPLDHEE